MITAEDLTIIPEFADLEEDDREWLAGFFEDCRYEDGEEIVRFLDSSDHLMVVFEGTIRILRHVQGSFRFFSEVGVGQITGMLPYSRMEVYEAKGDAVGPTRVGLMHKDRFPEVLYRMPILGQRLVALMTDRVRRASERDESLNKLLALGKLSAGLAHELNNPAAAARRAAADLDDFLQKMPGTVSRLLGHGLTPESVIPVAEACSMYRSHSPSNALDLADREDELTDWMEARGVENAWQLAPAMSECGITVSHLENATRGLDEDAVNDVLTWMYQSTSASRLISEVSDASERISELVRSVKSYSHMDRSTEKQAVDVRTGIESTLTMLGHKSKQKAIRVSTEFPDDLPLVSGYPGELNQVWTNIIDNAIDAVDDEGTLRVVGAAHGDYVEICIEDNGPGIPADVLPHIFEPFYSTKDVGQGTGQGLDIAHRIIVEQHRGEILVESEPGQTRFRIQLPKA